MRNTNLASDVFWREAASGEEAGPPPGRCATALERTHAEVMVAVFDWAARCEATLAAIEAAGGGSPGVRAEVERARVDLEALRAELVAGRGRSD